MIKVLQWHLVCLYFEFGAPDGAMFFVFQCGNGIIKMLRGARITLVKNMFVAIGGTPDGAVFWLKSQHNNKKEKDKCCVDSRMYTLSLQMLTWCTRLWKRFSHALGNVYN